MGQFYIDESIHDEGGFIIGACIYTNIDVNEKIIDIIKHNGFDPNNFEFKSNANYSKEPTKAKVRESLKNLLGESCKLGIVVIPRKNRDKLGFECIKALKQFISFNKSIKNPLSIYFDQGIFPSKEKAITFISTLKLADCNFYLGEDSKIIKGIQLADLAAHITSIQLKETLGLITKKVPFIPYPNDDFETEIELGFEMFLTLRYSFFNRGYTTYTDNPIKDATVAVEPYGLYISDLCDQNLANLARATFSEVYLGSID